MDTIVTPVTVITLDSTRIVHSIKADLVARYFPPVVRLVQYDQSLPVIAVSMMQNGQTYTLPSGAAANIRVHKPDATYVYNPALGCDSTRNIVYFEVTQAMAAANGDGLAIVEIVVDGDIAGTSLITLHFEENPVPEDAIESSDEWETIYELGERIIASTVTPVSTAAGMTDHNVVYLYTGTESGWNQGHMYYYNGTTWVDAGIAVTDKTLTVEGLAADAKKTGEEIADLKDGLDAVTDQINATLITDTASGAIASFPDGADGVPIKSLSVDIEPVQDLHGQAKPYPAGGGKNMLAPRLPSTTQDGITMTNNGDGSFNFVGTATANTNFRIDQISGGSTANLRNYSAPFVMSMSSTATVGTLYLGGYKGGTWTTPSCHVNSNTKVTDNIDNAFAYIRFNNGDTVNATFYLQIESGSTATAWSPYSNICPISGHTSATVTRCGKNLASFGGQGYWNASGVFTPDTVTVHSSPVFVKNGQSVSVKSEASTVASHTIAVFNDKNLTEFLSRTASSTSKELHFTATQDCYITVQINANFIAITEANYETVAKEQIEYGTTATAYEPYNVQTVTIDLDGTRYGGMMNVETGEMTVTHAYYQFTGSETINGTVDNAYINTSAFPTQMKVGTWYTDAKTLCDCLPKTNVGKGIRFGADNKTIYFYDLQDIVPAITDKTSLDAWIASQKPCITYPIEPVTIQLTANEISTLLGQNNIWNDCGDTEVEYRADTKLYINKVLNA